MTICRLQQTPPPSPSVLKSATDLKLVLLWISRLLSDPARCDDPPMRFHLSDDGHSHGRQQVCTTLVIPTLVIPLLLFRPYLHVHPRGLPPPSRTVVWPQIWHISRRRTDVKSIANDFSKTIQKPNGGIPLALPPANTWPPYLLPPRHGGWASTRPLYTPRTLFLLRV